MNVEVETTGVAVTSHTGNEETFSAHAALVRPYKPGLHPPFVAIGVGLGKNVRLHDYVDLDEIDASIATFENLVDELVTIRNSLEEKSDDA